MHPLPHLEAIAEDTKNFLHKKHLPIPSDLPDYDENDHHDMHVEDMWEDYEERLSGIEQ